MGKSHLQGKIQNNIDRNERRRVRYSEKEETFDIRKVRKYVEEVGNDIPESGGHAKYKDLKKEGDE